MDRFVTWNPSYSRVKELHKIIIYCVVYLWVWYSVCYSGGRIGVETLPKGMLTEMCVRLCVCVCVLRKKIVLSNLTFYLIEGKSGLR